MTILYQLIVAEKPLTSYTQYSYRQRAKRVRISEDRIKPVRLKVWHLPVSAGEKGVANAVLPQKRNETSFI